jgi:hypothetical protein
MTDPTLRNVYRLFPQARENAALRYELLELAHQILGLLCETSQGLPADSQSADLESQTVSRAPSALIPSPMLPLSSAPLEMPVDMPSLDEMDDFFASVYSEAAIIPIPRPPARESHGNAYGNYAPPREPYIPTPAFEAKLPLEPSQLLEQIAERADLKAQLVRGILDNESKEITRLSRELRSIEGRISWIGDLHTRLGKDKLEGLEGNFTTLSKIAHYLNRTGTTVKGSLELLAEVQSAVRGSMLEVGESGTDIDQRAIFQWLREYTGSQRVYLDRHMRMDDPADPRAFKERLERLQVYIDQI